MHEDEILYGLAGYLQPLVLLKTKLRDLELKIDGRLDLRTLIIERNASINEVIESTVRRIIG